VSYGDCQNRTVALLLLVEYRYLWTLFADCTLTLKDTMQSCTASYMWQTLHWLPVWKRIIFKMAVLVWKCLHNIGRRYLVDLCVPVVSAQGRQHLQSASSSMLLVPRTRTTIGQRSFAVSGPTTWNCLPASLRSSDMTLQTFIRQLKTFLFRH